MSHFEELDPLGRGTPRSSLAGQFAPLAGIWLIAALPVCSEIVGAGPPLSWSGPKFGSPLENVDGHVLSPKLRLKPPSSTELEQFPPPFTDSSELRTVIAAPCTNTPPALPLRPVWPWLPLGEPAPPPVPPAPELFPAAVTWSSVALDGLAAPTPPPFPPGPPLPPLPPVVPPGAALPPVPPAPPEFEANVELVTDTVPPSLQIPPPFAPAAPSPPFPPVPVLPVPPLPPRPPLPAVLPRIVLLFTVSAPPAFSMPPPTPPAPPFPPFVPLSPWAPAPPVPPLPAELLPIVSPSRVRAPVV